MGPWLVTRDELTHRDDLALGCSVNGERMQDARTSDLIFSVPRLVAELSSVVPILPADVIFTGTPRAGWASSANRRVSSDRATCSSRGSRASAPSTTAASENRKANHAPPARLRALYRADRP